MAAAAGTVTRVPAFSFGAALAFADSTDSFAFTGRAETLTGSLTGTNAVFMACHQKYKPHRKCLSDRISRTAQAAICASPGRPQLFRPGASRAIRQKRPRVSRTLCRRDPRHQ